MPSIPLFIVALEQKLKTQLSSYKMGDLKYNKTSYLTTKIIYILHILQFDQYLTVKPSASSVATLGQQSLLPKTAY